MNQANGYQQPHGFRADDQAFDPNAAPSMANTGTMGQDTPTLVGSMTGMIDKLKGPVFWLAVGFVACKVMDRKKKTVV